MTGWNVGADNSSFDTRPIQNIIPFSAANQIISSTDIAFTAANSPDEVNFGAMDSLNIYWRCDSNPQTKLLIKDIMIYRYG